MLEKSHRNFAPFNDESVVRVSRNFTTSSSSESYIDEF